MCFRTSGLFCACLLFSCVVHHCRCTNKKEDHNHHIGNQDEHYGQLSEKVHSQYFVQELFRMFGHNGVLDLKQFQKMIESLGIVLDTSYDSNHQKRCHHISAASKFSSEYSESQNSTVRTLSVDSSTAETESSVKSDVYSKVESTPPEKLTLPMKLNNTNKTTEDPEKQNSSFQSNKVIDDTFSIISSNKCFTAHELVNVHNLSMKDDVITPADFHELCPALIYQISHKICREDHDHHHQPKEIEYYVWLYTILAELIISACGLLCVAVIPIIQRVCPGYHTLLQFLISVGIGSLSGDALLHLLPHSMVSSKGHQHDGDDHDTTLVWRGLIALIGLYFFWITERLINMTTTRKVKRRKRVLQVPKFTRPLTNVDGETSKAVGEKLSHHKHGSYGYKFDASAVESLEKLSTSTFEEKKDPKFAGEQTESQEDDNEPKADVKNTSFSIKPLHVDVTYLPSEAEEEPKTSPTEECHRETVVYRHDHEDHYVVTITDHHQHHSHHGHSHGLARAASSLGWVVIIGDCFHNFCDGMAIGAAFASGISVGISTSVAVLFHELPHELGDFALLLKAGMSVKQAMLYNGISSIFGFTGSILGVFLGNIPAVTGWISAATAGMFVYIALVNMLPELNAVSEHDGCQHFLLQSFGITIGLSIMLLIALYEHDLHHLVS